MKLKTQVLALAGLGAILIGPAVSIAGQDLAAANTTHPVVNDATLNRAAAAFLEVDQFIRIGNEEIASTNNAAEKKQIADATEQAASRAVKENGLQPAQYNQIMELVMADRVLEQKFISDVDKAQAAYD